MLSVWTSLKFCRLGKSYMVTCLVSCITEMHLSFTTQSQLSINLRKIPSENIVGKAEKLKLVTKHFLLFSTMYPTLPSKNCNF